VQIVGRTMAMYSMMGQMVEKDIAIMDYVYYLSPLVDYL
tara:strand:- start:663 stop:779 length:117 start_codon:yes stop_codon:yes gene_type:complete